MAVGQKSYFAQFVFYLCTVSVPVCLFQVEERYCIGLIVSPICKLIRIGKWSEHRFTNEISGKLELALFGDESQLRIPKCEPDTMLSYMVPLESIEIEYNDEC